MTSELVRVALSGIAVFFEGVSVVTKSAQRHVVRFVKVNVPCSTVASLSSVHSPSNIAEYTSARVRPVVPIPERKPIDSEGKRIPASSLERALRFGGLAASLAFGSLSSKSVLNEANAQRLSSGLARMRGAALKLGQMMSILDDDSLPVEIREALNRVRDAADVMPRKQLEKVLIQEYGQNWEQKFKSFDVLPLAAASIGQVHKAELLDGRKVAVKVQYPGVAKSIDSDLANLTRILRVMNIFPKGLYVDSIISVSRQELLLECDYEAEAQNQKRFAEVLSSSLYFHVPAVISELSTKKILVTEFVQGLTLKEIATQCDQEIRNLIASRLLKLCLDELFRYRYVQTDPNWSNFYYDPNADKLNLIDFGAAREYPKEFLDEYLRMIYACASRNRDAVIISSIKLGLLSGLENQQMMDAHVESAFIVGEPFASDKPYDFASSKLTPRLRNLAAIMLRNRIKPPPPEIYSLHRKLSGAFLTCISLKANISCRQDFLDVYENYRFSS